MLENWQLPIDFSTKFLESVKLAVAQDLHNFRLNPEICTVIENSTQAGALNDIAYINKNYQFLWQYVERFRTSDAVGNPDVYNFEKIGKFSPSTIRYIKALGDLVRYFDALSQCKVIAEIGAGYGGLCKLIHDFCNPNIYTLYDLEACMDLQIEFLNKFDINFTLLKGNLDQAIAPGGIDLVIASCSWSELQLPMREKYLENVIKKAKCGYFVLNYDTEQNIEMLKKALPDKTFIRDADNPYILIFR